MFKNIAVIIVIISCSACGTTRLGDDPTRHISNDPLENINRTIYKLNRNADRYVLKPIAKGYDNVLPKRAKYGVRNFFGNLNEPLNALNNLLQGKVDRSLTSIFRLIVNSTVGVAGLIDIADYVDVKAAPEDLGQTLASWGVGSGPYLMLPFLGPSNGRDFAGRVGDSFIFSPNFELSDSRGVRGGLVFLDFLSLRAALLGSESLLSNQLDEYAFLKQAFEQNRINQLYDGQPPVVEEDFDDF